MKKRVIKIAALVVLFAAVLVISNVILNRGNDDQVVDMGDWLFSCIPKMYDGTECRWHIFMWLRLFRQHCFC